MVVPDVPRRSVSESIDSHTPSHGESSRRSHRGRHFLTKHGSKLHAFEPAKAPWPLSYDKATLELEMMDTALTSGYKGVISLVDHKGKEPARCLDIGTGLGLWVTQSAKYWKKSTFVGFDLVDVQIPLSILEPDEASRIEWVYGNILTGPLPFDDEEFDHVRITEVALGIPEHKWTPVFEEVRRVMKPGATIEIIEEDAIFPVLPRWFTEPLHARTRWPSISMQDGSKLFSNPQITPSPEIAHEYELLEILFNKVFSRRFINVKPSSTLPAAFSTSFGHVISPPVLTVPMPPLPPVQPRPPPRNSTASRNSDSTYGDQGLLYDANAHDEMSLATFNARKLRKKGPQKSDSAKSSRVSLPSPLASASSIGEKGMGSANGHGPGSANGYAHRYGHTSTASLVRSYSDKSIAAPSAMKDVGRMPRNASATSLHSSRHGHGNTSPSASMPPPPVPTPTTATTTMLVGPSGVGIGIKSSRASIDTGGSSRSSMSAAAMADMASRRTAMIHDLAATSTMIGQRAQIEMFPIDTFLMFDVHTLCLHLRRALGVVLAIREAMWEELQMLVTSPRRDVDLDKYGFYVHEDTLESVRAKYVQLLDQYKSDMHVRMSLWHSLVHFGWDYPQRDPMSKAEEMEEIRLREDILAARRRAGAENEREPPCRAVRVLVGAKVG